MAVMLGNLYEAPREAGVPEDRAQKAAEEAAASSDLLELRKDMSQVKTDLAVLKWMVGFSLASVIGGFAIVIRLLSR